MRAINIALMFPSGKPYVIHTNTERPKPKGKPKRKVTDKERHKRFVDMAHEVQADESLEAFDRAFRKVVSIHPRRSSE